MFTTAGAMNQSKPIHNPLYEHFLKAAQTLIDELNLFGNDASSEVEEEENNEAENHREIFFLRSMLEYFYANKVYPNPTSDNVPDFCIKFMKNMTVDEFSAHHSNYRKKYMKRVIKLCRKHQFLDQPHDQEAFDLGNRIWGTRSFEMVFEVKEEEEDDDDDLNDSSDNNKNQDQDETSLPTEKEKDKHQVGDLLNRCPFLRGTFRFGSGVGRIPVVSESAVESAVGSLGESTVERWDDKWKSLQIQEMQNFLAQLNFIRHQTLTLLDELQNNNNHALASQGSTKTKRKK